MTHTPPRHCHRPHTPHTPLLIETRPLLLSPAQCSYIIHNIGDRTTNNGGKSFGPTYITAAALSIPPPQQQQHGQELGKQGGDDSNGVTVQLLNPNHHKVCVFHSELVLTWLQQAFQKAGIDEAIHKWCQANGIHNNRDDDSSSLSHYKINPRLRLLRYDAADHDIFLPHYDATTTTTRDTYESKLTILLYLNTGGGVDFHGGNTVFLNSLQPSENMMEVVATLGKLLVFNHELYHASQALITKVHHETIDGGSGSGGGTKFVLRSDVMFPIQYVVSTNHASDQMTSVPLQPLPLSQNFESTHDNDDDDDNEATRTTILLPMTVRTVLDQFVLSDMERSDHPLETLLAVLQQLDINHSMPLTTLMTLGQVAVVTMMMDLGLDEIVAEGFYRQCQEVSASLDHHNPPTKMI
jgi:hypothetical protein